VLAGFKPKRALADKGGYDKVTNRKGALQALQHCKPALNRGQGALCDSGYVGQPFAQGIRDIVGDQVAPRKLASRPAGQALSALWYLG
jgi:hypothetical protein